MQAYIFTVLAFGHLRYCRAENAQQARRIFARSLNAERPEGAREIRISLEQVGFIGHMLPASVGATGYDDAVKKMPQRFKDDTIGESYMSADIIKDAAADKAVKNAESIIAAYFD